MRCLPKTLAIGLLLILWASLAMAETIYLKSGKTIEGKILKYDKDSVTIESVADHQIHTIPKKDIYLINFDTLSVERYKKFKKQMDSSVVYLRNGEVIEGRISQMNADFLTIESLKGQGVLQLPTSEINMIASSKTQVDMRQRTGVGYVHNKSTVASANGSQSYTPDQLSYKTFLDEELFTDYLLAFGNNRIKGQNLKIFAADLRMGRIVKTFQNTLLYQGGSVGVLNITDEANDVNGSGFTLKLFVGAEMFFPSLPNFGFSGEIGMGYVNAGDYTAIDLTSTGFPTFSMHYYF